MARPPRLSLMVNYLILIGIGISIIFAGGPFGIFLFLILMGGGLAYLGDQLGIYFGKKRISLWGLRPKKTAMLVSVVTGMIITFFTLLGTSYLSENFSIAMLKVETLNEQVGSLRTRADGLSQRALNLEATNRELDRKRERLNEDKRALEKKVDEAEIILEKLRLDEQKKIEQINRLSRVVETKETSLVVLHKGQSLLDVPVLVPLGIDMESLGETLQRVVRDLRQRCSLLGIDFDLERYRKVQADVVAQVHGKIDRIREFYQQRRQADPSRYLPSRCYIQPRSTKNVSVGEQLQAIHFEVKPNMLIFREGEEVARTPVDGQLPEEKILEQLFYFDKQVLTVLQEKGVSSVSLRRRARMIPATQLVNFYRIAQLLRHVKKSLMVRFVASSDVYTFGEFDAVYKVEGIPDDLETRIAPERMISQGEEAISSGN